MSGIGHIVIVGATSGIAERCARQWAVRSPTHFSLIGRDAPRLERIAADLRVRAPGAVLRVVVADLLGPDDIQRCVDAAAQCAPIDIALIAHGWLPSQQECQNDIAMAQQALQVNGVSPVLWAEAFTGAMLKAGHGRLLVIGSVAGDRGRQSNYVYGAAKGMVERYVEGLQHRCTGTGVHPVLIKPGPTDTPMTAHLREQGARLADPETVAADIVLAADTLPRVRYTPWPWRWIMQVIRLIPAAIFHRTKL